MDTYIIEQFGGEKCVGKEKIRTDNYDDVLKRVADIVSKTDHKWKSGIAKRISSEIRMRVGSY